MNNSTYHVTSNGCSVSTTVWPGYGKIQGPPPGKGLPRAQRVSIFALRWRDPRKPLTVTLQYRGGPEGLWVAECRGWRWKFPGMLCVQDVMNWINRTHLG